MNECGDNDKWRNDDGGCCYTYQMNDDDECMNDVIDDLDDDIGDDRADIGDDIVELWWVR